MIAALFHFDATNEGSPRALCVYFKDPMEVLHCHHTGTCAAAFSVQCFCSISVCAQGGVRRSVCLRVPKREQSWDRSKVVTPDACREEFVGTGTNVFL